MDSTPPPNQKVRRSNEACETDHSPNLVPRLEWMELHLHSPLYTEDVQRVKTEFQGRGTNPERIEYRFRFVSVYSRHYSPIPISGTGANFNDSPTLSISAL